MSVTVFGQLRWSKGTWLFRPDDVDVLLRVHPIPAPDTTGFRAAHVVGRLKVTAGALRPGTGPDGVFPRTGIPATLHGIVRERSGDELVIDVGVPILVAYVDGVSTIGLAADAAVQVDVDVDRGVQLLL
jgi:hypothetical protein